MALQFAATYFFVPLLVGWIVVSTAGDLRVQKVIGWSLVALGAWGAVSGVPYWWSAGLRAWRAEAHMDRQCKRAMEQLPATRLPAEGVLVVTDGAVRASIPVEKLVLPGAGRFQRVQEQRTMGKTIFDVIDHQWEPDRHANLGHVKRSVVAEPTLPYVLSIRSLTTDTDRRYGIEGLELTVLDRSTQAPVARRVQYVQGRGAFSVGERLPSRVCSDVPPEEGKCSFAPACAFGWTLALRALQPKFTLPPSQLFHLHRGMDSPRRMSCLLADPLRVSPGIRPADVEWWLGGPDGRDDDLHLRVRGGRDELVCDGFFAGGGPTRNIPLRFADGQEFLANALVPAGGQGPRQPKPLAPEKPWR